MVTVAATSVAGFTFLKSKPTAPARSSSSANALSAEMRTEFEQAETTLRSSHFKTKLEMRSTANCAAHSIGEVRSYFQSNPCKYLVRAYMQVGDVGRHLILVAASWVAMPAITSAEGYKRLTDSKAGGVIELSRETTLYKYITYEDAIYMSGIKGASVWNVEIKPMFAATPSEANTVAAAIRQEVR
jgi:hypothetical protein